MRKFLLVFFGVFAVLLFSGCSSGAVLENDKAGSVTSSFAAFGSSAAYENGLVVFVSEPEPFVPSDLAVGGSGENLKFTIRIVNGTGENYDPNMFFVTLQSGDEEADQIFDTAVGVGLSPSTVLLPSRETAWTVGFSVKDSTDLVMELSPGFFDIDPLIFTSFSSVELDT